MQRCFYQSIQYTHTNTPGRALQIIHSAGRRAVIPIIPYPMAGTELFCICHPCHSLSTVPTEQHPSINILLGRCPFRKTVTITILCCRLFKHGSHLEKHILTDKGLMASPFHAVIPAVHIMAVPDFILFPTGYPLHQTAHIDRVCQNESDCRSTPLL